MSVSPKLSEIFHFYKILVLFKTWTFQEIFQPHSKPSHSVIHSETSTLKTFSHFFWLTLVFQILHISCSFFTVTLQRSCRYSAPQAFFQHWMLSVRDLNFRGKNCHYSRKFHSTNTKRYQNRGNLVLLLPKWFSKQKDWGFYQKTANRWETQAIATI